MKGWKWMALAGSGLLLIYAAVMSWNHVFEVEAEPRLSYKHIDGKPSSSNYLLEVPIYGEILTDSLEPAVFDRSDATYGYHVQRLLKRVSAEPKVKGILLRLRTGGGTVVGSEAIYEALKDYRKVTQKPVIAHIEGISASGGVMAMMGANKIYAAPASNIGSIGVVDETFNVYDKPNSISINDEAAGVSISAESGIETIVISAGKGKDLGYSNRKPTGEELKVMRQGVNNSYTNFVKLVSKTRGIPEKTIRNEMGAYTFDNKTAEKYKLIDGTKSRLEAIALLAERAKLGEDFRLVRLKPAVESMNWWGSSAALTFEQKQHVLNRDRCAAAKNAVLAYHGNIRELCQ